MVLTEPGHRAPRGQRAGGRRSSLKKSKKPPRPSTCRSRTTSYDPVAHVSQGHRQGAAADRERGGRAGQADRARRHRRQAADGRGQPAPGRLDRQELPRPRPALPRPDPGGHPRADPGRREVRLPPRLQVLDLRDLVDPPGRHARDRRQGAHDPHPRAHGREAQQGDRASSASWSRARPRADRRGDRRVGIDCRRRSSRDHAMAQQPVSLEKPVGDEEDRSSATSSPTSRRVAPRARGETLQSENARARLSTPAATASAR